MAYDMSQLQKMVGNLAQRANPQGKDPFQNINPAGLPVAKKPPMNAPMSPMKPWQMPQPGVPQKPTLGGGRVPIGSTPTRASLGGMPQPAGASLGGSYTPQPGQMNGAMSLEEARAAQSNASLGGMPQPVNMAKPLPIPQAPPTSSLGGMPQTAPAESNVASEAIGQDPRFSNVMAEAEARAAQTGIGGSYTPGGYTPIQENKQWSGEGYSGVDPRDASTASPIEAAPEPTAQGGKGGAGAMDQGGAFAGGAPAGGKSGGASPEAPAPPGAVEQPPTPGSNPNDIKWDDTGNYNPNVGGFNTFTPAYEQQAGTTATVTGHEKGGEETQARIQDFTNQQLSAWEKAGGNAGDFQRFNPKAGSFANYAKGPERHAARMAARDKFYQDQLNALLNGKKPGVQ